MTFNIIIKYVFSENLNESPQVALKSQVRVKTRIVRKFKLIYLPALLSALCSAVRLIINLKNFWISSFLLVSFRNELKPLTNCNCSSLVKSNAYTYSIQWLAGLKRLIMSEKKLRSVLPIYLELHPGQQN